MRYVGVTGRAGSGKDTFCNLCIQHLLEHGIIARKLAFAHKLKSVLADVYGTAYDVPNSAFFGTQAEKAAMVPTVGLSGREITQIVGTSGFRAASESVWTRYAFKKADELQITDGATVIFFSDLRFIEEANEVKARDGHIVRIKRPSIDAQKNSGVPGHRSETELELIQPDFVICNDREELSDLRGYAKSTLRKIGLI